MKTSFSYQLKTRNYAISDNQVIIAIKANN